MSSKDLEEFRTRWRRWLGQKCRSDKSYWTTLLDSNWTGWPDLVYGEDYVSLHITSDIIEIKKFYLDAINRATMDQLYKLDALYASDKLGW